MKAPLGVIDLGQMMYQEAHQLQRELCDRRIAGEIDRDLLLLVEHESTITLGRGTKADSLPLAPEEIRRLGHTVVEIERGGDVTWHGPGQLVGYPILDLNRHKPDLHWYLRKVEEALIAGLARLGIPAERNPGLTGVWTGGKKIASIGIHVRRWVTTHGFALNVTNDQAGFGLIVPCGIQGVEMTTVNAARRQGGEAASNRSDNELWQETAHEVTAAFGAVFELTPHPVDLKALLPDRLAALPP